MPAMIGQELLRGWPGPGGRRIRLAGPADAPPAGRLLALAEHGLDTEAVLLAEDPRLAVGLRRGLSDGPDTLVRETVAALSSGTPREAYVGLSTVLVAAHPDGPPEGALMAIPPARVLENARRAGAGLVQVLGVAMAVIKIKGVAVAPEARGAGLGTALVQRCVRLYSELGWHVMYGQFGTDSGLDAFYAGLGFDVLAAGESLWLGDLVGFPLGIRPAAGERLFVRWE